jgi:dUTP pyrophosphatase
MKVKIKKLHPNAVIPKYATVGSSGFDLVSTMNVTIAPNATALIPTGLAMAVDQGFELQVRPRSGLSLKTGLRVANAPGTVDSDYRGEICVIVTNTGDDYAIVTEGTRIAQGVVCPIIQVEFEEVEDLDDTTRGSGGFGSTGK